MARLAKRTDLPRAIGEVEGDPRDRPVADTRYAHLLVDAWHQEEVERDRRFRDPEVAGVSGARFYHSMAGSCARAIAYAALGIEADQPMDMASHWITRQGRLLHEAFQETVRMRYPDAAIEVKVSAKDRGGHADLEVVTDQGETDAIEYKTVDGYSFKKAVGIPPAARVPQGPTYSHKLQAFLNARGLSADRAVIVYGSRGAISIQAARRHGLTAAQRVIAEWSYTREQYEPEADREIKRVTGILALLDEGTLPARVIPDPELPVRHRITNPLKGEWVEHDTQGKPLDAGETWHCHYCPWQGTCAQTHFDRQPVTVLQGVTR